MSMGDLLSIEPLELKFPFELKKQISCSLQLSNKADKYVAFKVKTTNLKKYCVRPNVGVVLPRSTCDVIVTMQAQKVPPADMQCKDKFLLQSVKTNDGVTSKDINAEMFNKEAGHIVEECILRVVYVSPPQPPSPVPEGSEEGSEKKRCLRQSSTHGSVSLASSSSTLLGTSNNLLKKLSSLKKTQNSTSTSSSEILQDLQRKRKALKEYLGLSLEAIDEANAFAEIKRIALLLLQHSASSLEKAILKYLVSSLAAFKEIVPATNSRMENVRARMLCLSWKKADVRSRLCQGQEQLSSLEVRFSKLLEEEWELEMQVWDMLLTTRDELSITKKSVSLELEMINEKVAADLEDLREISEEDELVANDWIQAREKLAQANLNWQLFKQNLELCEKSV